MTSVRVYKCVDCEEEFESLYQMFICPYCDRDRLLLEGVYEGD